MDIKQNMEPDQEINEKAKHLKQFGTQKKLEISKVLRAHRTN